MGGLEDPHNPLSLYLLHRPWSRKIIWEIAGMDQNASGAPTADLDIPGMRNSSRSQPTGQHVNSKTSLRKVSTICETISRTWRVSCKGELDEIMMTDISMVKMMATGTQEMEGVTVMVAMMGEEEIPHRGAVTKETITMMEGTRRAGKEVSLKDGLAIKMVLMTIAKVIKGITEKLGVDVVNEGHQAEVVSTMKG